MIINDKQIIGARLSEPQISELCTICSFRPQGSKCIPGAKMSVIVNGSDICHRKVPTKQLSHGTKRPSNLFHKQ